MIFFTVGSQRPFDRLVIAADRLAARNGETVVVQCGRSCVRAQHAIYIDFLPFAEFVAQICTARLVVTHGGIGSVALCLRHGHRPIVVPRRRALGENIDDHQISFARKLAELGLITVVEDIEKLGVAVAEPVAAAQRTGLSSTLRDELVACISRYAAPDFERARSASR